MVVGTTLQTLSKLRNADRQAAALAQMREKVLADARDEVPVSHLVNASELRALPPSTHA